MNALGAPRRKRALAFVGGLIPPSTHKTRATAEAWGKKSHFYKPLPIRFQRDGFDYQQLAREGGAAIYEQVWCAYPQPSVCYEVIRIRQREGFEIGSRFVPPAEVYPNSEAWGTDGF